MKKESYSADASSLSQYLKKLTNYDMIWMTLGRLSDFNWNELAWEMNLHSHFPCWNKDSVNGDNDNSK